MNTTFTNKVSNKFLVKHGKYIEPSKKISFGMHGDKISTSGTIGVRGRATGMKSSGPSSKAKARQAARANPQ